MIAISARSRLRVIFFSRSDLTFGKINKERTTIWWPPLHLFSQTSSPYNSRQWKPLNKEIHYSVCLTQTVASYSNFFSSNIGISAEVPVIRDQNTTGYGVQLTLQPRRYYLVVTLTGKEERDFLQNRTPATPVKTPNGRHEGRQGRANSAVKRFVTWIKKNA